MGLHKYMYIEHRQCARCSGDKGCEILYTISSVWQRGKTCTTSLLFISSTPPHPALRLSRHSPATPAGECQDHHPLWSFALCTPRNSPCRSLCSWLPLPVQVSVQLCPALRSRPVFMMSSGPHHLLPYYFGLFSLYNSPW